MKKPPLLNNLDYIQVNTLFCPTKQSSSLLISLRSVLSPEANDHSTYVAVQAKVEMLDNLLDIEVAYSLLRGGAQDNEHDPIDLNYEKLKTKIEVRGETCFYESTVALERHLTRLVTYRSLTSPQRRLKSSCNTLRTPTLLHTTPTLWKCKMYVIIMRLLLKSSKITLCASGNLIRI